MRCGCLPRASRCLPRCGHASGKRMTSKHPEGIAVSMTSLPVQEVETKPSPEDEPKRAASFRDYVRIARPDHWTKHVFIIPGMILAYAIAVVSWDNLFRNIVLGFVSAASISSANYVINEWLDRDFDRHHPSKTMRVAVKKGLSPWWVYAEYVVLLAVGLGIAWSLSALFFYTTVAFAISGLIYNVRPIRSKDRVYIDVLTESLNNPIRLLLGWAMVDPATLPPSSILVAYWMGGAFLMGTKRLSEYRQIVRTAGVAVLHRYRSSFRFYSEERLLVSSFLYALLSSFCIAVFLVKYRSEYILALPLIAVMFTVYLSLSLETDSVAQRPEKLFRERILMGVTGSAVIALLLLSFIDLPDLDWISEPRLFGVSSQ